MERTARAIAYVRVSVVGGRAKQGRLESPDLQREAIDAWCSRHHIEVVREVRDLNRSGGTLTRPGLEEALEIVKTGGADGIVVARSDRASRRTIDGLELIEQLDRLGGWIAAADGTIDTTDRVARMATTMMFAVGQHELDRYREQSAEVHRRAILEKGRHMGPAPFGYVRDDAGRLAPDPDRADQARLVFERRAAGAGWVAIMHELDRAGVRQADGRRVTPQLVRRMVPRRVYVGEATHGVHVRSDSHPPLIGEALWRAANRVAPTVASSPRTTRTHPESLLRGLLRCAGCRYTMKRMPQPSGAVRWVCRASLPAIGASWDCAAPARLTGRQSVEAEAIVVDRLMQLVAGVDTERIEVDSAELVEAERTHAEAEALLDELSSLAVRRELGADRWSRMTAEARAAVQDAEQRLASARMQARSAGERGTAVEEWSLMEPVEQHEALCSVVQAVMVTAGDGPVAGRLDVVAVWEPADLPRKGVHGFVARPWPDDGPPGAAAAAGDAG